MNKFTKFTASIVTVGALTFGVGSAAFASDATPTPTGPKTEHVRKHTKEEICANKAALETKAAERRQNVVGRIAKLNKVKVDKAAELTKHPEVAARLDARIAKLTQRLSKIDARVAKLNEKCASSTPATEPTTTPTA